MSSGTTPTDPLAKALTAKDPEEVGIVESCGNDRGVDNEELLGCKIYAAESVPNYIFVKHERGWNVYKKDRIADYSMIDTDP